MNEQSPPPSAPGPRYVAPKTGFRDKLIAITAGLAFMGIVVYGVRHMGKPHQSANILVGVVIGKQFTPQREQQVSFSGKHLEGARQIAGEYVLKVQVDSEHRTYEVPVEQGAYESKKEGDTLEFVRPPSEQR